MKTRAHVSFVARSRHALASRSRGDTPADQPAPASAASDEPLTLYMRSWPALARVHITTHGALRGDATRHLLAAVAEHAHPDSTIILDLSEITAIDEPAAAALRECPRLAEARGADLELHDPSPVVRSALRTHHPERH